MSDDNRLPVNILIVGSVVGVESIIPRVLRNISTFGIERKNPEDVPASFNRWREKHDVPVKFNMKLSNMDDPVPPEHFDILVNMDMTLFRPTYPSVLRDKNSAEADFTIELGYSSCNLPESKVVTLGSLTDDNLHWALDHWFVNKHTKISSRLATLPQYERLLLERGADGSIQSCKKKANARKDETSLYIVECLENVIRRYESALREKDVKMGDMHGTISEMKNEIEEKGEKIKEFFQTEHQKEKLICRLQEQLQTSCAELEKRHTGELKEKVAEIDKMCFILSGMKDEIEKKDERIDEITKRNHRNEELISQLQEQVQISSAELEKKVEHEVKIREQISEMEKKVEERNKEIQKMACSLDFLQEQTLVKQEKIHQLENEKERVRDDKYDLELKKAECRELSEKYKNALDSMAAWNQLLNDMENRLRKDNRESTGQLLETVDQIWQGQKDEILSSIEIVGDDMIGYLKSHGEALGTQTCSHTERRDKSQLEENTDLKNLCALLSESLGDSWRKIGRALEVSSRCLDDIEARYGRFGNEELVRGVLDKWAERGNPTKESLLQAVKRIGRENILGPPMTDHHRDILQTLHPYLHREMMDVELLFPYLRRDKILTSSLIEMIFQGHGRFGKIDNLLKMLPDSGCKAFDGFVHALEQSGQGHIAEKLREAESKDPCVVESAEIGGETVPKVASEETGVKEHVEGGASCDGQANTPENDDQRITDILRFVKQIDARTSRLEGYVDEKNTIIRQTSNKEES